MIPFSGAKKNNNKNLAHALLVLALCFCCCAHVIANKLFHTSWQWDLAGYMDVALEWEWKKNRNSGTLQDISKLDIWMLHTCTWVKKKKKNSGSWMQLSLHRMVIQCLYNYLLSLLLPCYSIFTVFEDFNLLYFLLHNKAWKMLNFYVHRFCSKKIRIETH